MKARKRTATAAGGVLAAAALLAACGGSGSSDAYGNNAGAYAGNAPPAASTAPAAAPSASVKTGTSEPAAVAPALELVAARTKALGWVVTDGKGWILYRFDKDRAKPAKSTCTGACSQKWPPVLVHGKPVLKGLPASLVGKVRRDDGTWQLTLHGWPVYRFAGDTTPGQWKGQGLGGTWYTIKRNGSRNTTKPAAPAAAPAPSISDGYGNTSGY